MDGVDEDAEVLGVDVGRDAVAEVEYVARAIAVACQRVGDALANDLGAFAERRGIKVAGS